MNTPITNALTPFLVKINAEIINPLILLLFAVAVVVFLWGGLQFVLGAGDEKVREDGKRHLMWGIIGLVIMLGVYGILHVLLNTFGVSTAPLGQ